MANDGRWKFQSIVIVSSTLKIINVKGYVSDMNLGICPHRTPTREVYVVSVPTQQASHGRVSDGCRVKDYTEELLGLKEDNEFTQSAQ